MSKPTPDKDEHFDEGTISPTPPLGKAPAPEMPILPETPEPIAEWWDLLPEMGKRKRWIKPVQLVPFPGKSPSVPGAPDQRRHDQMSREAQVQELLENRPEHLALLETLHLPT